mmetsp:Transcript_33352/g.33972  ORF Transcript_33352/g.33972 Transcript_33352/m.33972 type:complete len:217 (+) Transcript_33352:279-929(+)
MVLSRLPRYIKLYKLTAYIVTAIMLWDPQFSALKLSSDTISYLFLPRRMGDMSLHQLSYYGCKYAIADSRHLSPSAASNTCLYIIRPLEFLRRIFSFSFGDDSVIYNYEKSARKNIRHLDLFKTKLVTMTLNESTKSILGLSSMCLLLGTYAHPFFIILGVIGYISIENDMNYDVNLILFILCGLSVVSCTFQWFWPEAYIGQKFRGRGRKLGSAD